MLSLDLTLLEHVVVINSDRKIVTRCLRCEKDQKCICVDFKVDTGVNYAIRCGNIMLQPQTAITGRYILLAQVN